MTATPDKYEFRTYLESIAQRYQNWSNLYTLTDAVGKQQVNMPLMAELILPKQDERGQQKKGERLPVLEGICKYAADHVLLVGKPGSGKSTALQRLLWEKAIIADVIPVLVELRSWQPETGSVIKLIQKIFQRNKLRLNEDEIEDLLFDGKLLLLLDGLNELPSDESRRLVAEFRQDYPQTPMIFTTRDLGVGGDLGIEKQLLMQPLTLSQMRAFALVYLPEQGEEMLRQLNDKLQKFAETPLLLWMLCDVYAQSGKIPRNLGESFRNFTNIYDNKLKADVPGYKNYRDWCRNLLEVLAYQMMSGATETEFRLNICIRLAEDILTEYLKQENFDKPRDYAKRWLEDLLEHHLISMVDNEKIEFRHQLFQEYYAAEYLLRLLPSLSDERLKKDYLNLLKWTETVALMLALVDNETQALRVVRLALDVDLMLGARLAGEINSNYKDKTKIIIKKLPNFQEYKDWLFSISPQTIFNERINDENNQIEIIGYAGASFSSVFTDRTSSCAFLIVIGTRLIHFKCSINLRFS